MPMKVHSVLRKVPSPRQQEVDPSLQVQSWQCSTSCCTAAGSPTDAPSAAAYMPQPHAIEAARALNMHDTLCISAHGDPQQRVSATGAANRSRSPEMLALPHQSCPLPGTTGPLIPQYPPMDAAWVAMMTSVSLQEEEERERDSGEEGQEQLSGSRRPGTRAPSNHWDPWLATQTEGLHAKAAWPSQQHGTSKSRTADAAPVGGALPGRLLQTSPAALEHMCTLAAVHAQLEGTSSATSSTLTSAEQDSTHDMAPSAWAASNATSTCGPPPPCSAPDLVPVKAPGVGNGRSLNPPGAVYHAAGGASAAQTNAVARAASAPLPLSLGELLAITSTTPSSPPTRVATCHATQQSGLRVALAQRQVQVHGVEGYPVFYSPPPSQPQAQLVSGTAAQQAAARMSLQTLLGPAAHAASPRCRSTSHHGRTSRLEIIPEGYSLCTDKIPLRTSTPNMIMDALNEMVLRRARSSDDQAAASQMGTAASTLLRASTGATAQAHTRALLQASNRPMARVWGLVSEGLGNNSNTGGDGGECANASGAALLNARSSPGLFGERAVGVAGPAAGRSSAPVMSGRTPLGPAAQQPQRASWSGGPSPSSTAANSRLLRGARSISGDGRLTSSNAAGSPPTGACVSPMLHALMAQYVAPGTKPGGPAAPALPAQAATAPGTPVAAAPSILAVPERIGEPVPLGVNSEKGRVRPDHPGRPAHQRAAIKEQPGQQPACLPFPVWSLFKSLPLIKRDGAASC